MAGSRSLIAPGTPQFPAGKLLARAVADSQAGKLARAGKTSASRTLR